MLTVELSVVMVMVAMAMGDTGRMFESNLQDDVIFDQNLLFEAQAISKVACSGLCATTDDCSTFTFHKESGVCRGHALSVTSSSPVTSMLGTKAYTEDNGYASCDAVPCAANCSGVYKIYPPLIDPLRVYCDVNTDPPNGWMVIQRRQDGSVDFYRDWTDYEAGFGANTGEFWIGLQTLYQLTSRQDYSLRVDLEDFQDNKAYAIYTHFSLSGPADNYRLNISGPSGTAGNSMTSSFNNNGMQFSTPDRDHDTWGSNCAASLNHGAWWYRACTSSNLNGLYRQDGPATNSDGINWRSWYGDRRPLKHVEMKIRPRN